MFATRAPREVDQWVSHQKDSIVHTAGRYDVNVLPRDINPQLGDKEPSHSHILLSTQPFSQPHSHTYAMSDNWNNNNMQGGNNAQFNQGGQQGGEKPDWLDKGIQDAGDKAGVNIVCTVIVLEGKYVLTDETEPEECGYRGRLCQQGIGEERRQVAYSILTHQAAIHCALE